MRQVHAQWLRVKDFVRERGKFIHYCAVRIRYYNRMAEYTGAKRLWDSKNGWYYRQENDIPVPFEIYTTPHE